MGPSRQILLNLLSQSTITISDLQRQIISHDLFGRHETAHISNFRHQMVYEFADNQRVSERDIQLQFLKFKSNLDESESSRVQELINSASDPIQAQIEPTRESVKKTPEERKKEKEEKAEKTKKQEENQLKLKRQHNRFASYQWRLMIEDFLLHLLYDLELLEKVERWDLSIFQEALKLISFLHHIFDVDFKALFGNHDKYDGFIGGPLLSKRIRNNLYSIHFSRNELVESVRKKAGKDAEKLEFIEQIIESAKWEAIRSDGKIGSATLRELLVRNQVCQQQDKLLRMFQNKTREEAESLMDSAVFELLAPSLSQFVSQETQIKAAWIPRTISIVLDTEFGMILTGATQACCENFLLLKKTAARINRIRLGEHFVHIIDRCSQEYSELVTPIASAYKDRPELMKDFQEAWFESLYSELIKEGNLSPGKVSQLEEKCTRVIGSEDGKSKKRVKSLLELCAAKSWPTTLSENRDIPQPRKNTHILSWAISGEFVSPDEDPSSMFIEPCLRCQRLYRRWVLHKHPGNTSTKMDCLQAGFRQPSSETKFERGESFCCAESVSAAKLYTLRNGTVFLV